MTETDVTYGQPAVVTAAEGTFYMGAESEPGGPPVVCLAVDDGDVFAVTVLSVAEARQLAAALIRCTQDTGRT